MDKSIFIALLVVLLPGCIGSDVASSVPIINSFLEQHPNADVRVNFLSKLNVEAMLPEIREACGNPLMEAGDYYKIDVQDAESGLSMKAWIDFNTKTVVCAIKEGKDASSEAEQQTSVAIITEITTEISGSDAEQSQTSETTSGSETTQQQEYVGSTTGGAGGAAYSVVVSNATSSGEIKKEYPGLNVKITAPAHLSTLDGKDVLIRAETDSDAVCDIFYRMDAGYMGGILPRKEMSVSKGRVHEYTIKDVYKGYYEVTIGCRESTLPKDEDCWKGDYTISGCSFTSSTAKVKFYTDPKKDYDPPVITVSSPKAGELVQSAYTNIKVSTNEEARCTYHVVYEGMGASTPAGSLDLDFAKEHSDSVKNGYAESVNTLQVSCRDRSDNTAETSVAFKVNSTAKATKPDLVIAGVSFSPPPAGMFSFSGGISSLILDTEGRFNFTINVTNKGIASVESGVEGSITFSSESGATDSDSSGICFIPEGCSGLSTSSGYITFGTFACGAIAPGQTVSCGTLEHYFTIPSEIEIKIDSYARIGETDESNNAYKISVFRDEQVSGYV